MPGAPETTTVFSGLMIFLALSSSGAVSMTAAVLPTSSASRTCGRSGRPAWTGAPSNRVQDPNKPFGCPRAQASARKKKKKKFFFFFGPWCAESGNRK
eukprot:4589030-Prymnesium_polylepis.1